jgi:hypothetical protein
MSERRLIARVRCIECQGDGCRACHEGAFLIAWPTDDLDGLTKAHDVFDVIEIVEVPATKRSA